MRSDVLRTRNAEYVGGDAEPVPDPYSAWVARQHLADHIADTAVACDDCGALRPKELPACPDCEGR